MLNFLRKNVFIPLNDSREGNIRFKFLKEYSAQLDAPIDITREFQLSKIKNVLRYAYENVPFYRELYDENKIDLRDIVTEDDFQQIPIISKNDIRNYNEKFLSREFDKKDLIRTGTGGTTSSPIDLYYTNECFSQKQACTLYFYRWFGYEPGDPIAYLWGAEQDFPQKPTIKSRLRYFLTTNQLMLPSSYLNDEIMWDYYAKLKKVRPKVLQCYPTPLYIFSNFLEQNNLTLDIQNINMTAEYLYDYQREKIEAVFNKKVFNWYGVRELGHVATECALHKGLHINTVGTYLEAILDGQRVFDIDGQIVATDLLNFAMPLIRYRIGDIGNISERECACGSNLPILEEVGGRYVDTFKKRDGSSIPGVSFTNRIITSSGGIKELQIVQKDYEFFELNIVKGDNYSDDAVDQLKSSINRFMHAELEFSINFVQEIALEKSGKIRFCKSDIAEQ